MIGTTRCRILRALDHATSTSKLADRLGVSLSSVSRQTAVLRRSGMVTSIRHGPAVLHVRTELGTAVLCGELPS